MKENLDSIMKNSILFPVLVETGSAIMKLDPIETSDDINKTVSKNSEIIEDGIDKTLQNKALEIVDSTKKKITQTMEQNLSAKERK